MVKHTWITENMQANLPEWAYKISENELNSSNRIDLNDMIIKSRELVDKYKIKLKYKAEPTIRLFFNIYI